MKRFTPTGVGTMYPHTRLTCHWSVHPHGRGDNTPSSTYSRTTGGSPPRAWGQLRVPHHHRATERFTPTGVGTMDKPCSEGVGAAVHPHGRGDNATLASDGKRRGGSPPRAWGQWGARYGCALPVRFTPTGVGTMAEGVNVFPAWAVHPHGRGDNTPPSLSQHPLFGSPPRAWGQLPHTPRFVNTQRFTPTGVGTIAYLLRCHNTCSVHPHGRGDNLVDNPRGGEELGSPPRAWGQLNSDGEGSVTTRFTPTGVGTIGSVTV